MPVGNYQLGSSDLFGPTFGEFRRRLGLFDQPVNRPFLPPSLSGFGRGFLDSPEGAGALYSLFGQYFDRPAQALSRFINRNQGRIEGQYRAAAAIDPTISRSQFLANYDPNRLYRQSSFLERGERPWVYQRGFKTVGG